MVTVGRAIGGISLNGKEFILTEDNEPMMFANLKKAYAFLRKNGHKGWSDEQLEDNYFFDAVEDELINEEVL